MDKIKIKHISLDKEKNGINIYLTSFEKNPIG